MNSTPLLHDLNAIALRDGFAPVLGRDEEIDQVLEILSQTRKANAALIGPAGAGKTAIAEALALLAARGGEHLPAALRGCRVQALDTAALLAGAGVYGEIEKRVGQLFKALEGEKVVLFIDELHSLAGAGGREGKHDLLQLLKPYLARGGLRVLAATTAAEYTAIIARDAAFERRFTPVYVRALDAAASARALRAHAQRLGAQVSPALCRHAVKQAQRLLPARQLPDSAVDILERSYSINTLSGAGNTIRRKSIDSAVKRMARLPMDVEQRLARLGRRLPQAAAAVTRLRDVLRGSEALPLLLRASTTEAAALAAALANALSTEVIALPAELGDREIYGAEPGYVGHGRRLAIHQLCEQPFSVLLVEQAEPATRARLLGDLQRGALIDAEGRLIPFNLAVLATTPTRRIGFAG